MFSHPESCSKISNVMITELFYSTDVLLVQEVSGIYTSVLDRLLNKWLCGPKKFPWLFRKGLLARGVLPIMAYTRRLCLFGVPFSCYRYRKE